MSKLEVDKIDPQSGTDLELGSSGDTVTIPTGVTLDASNATTTLPANVVTTDGTQTLTNKTIDASQLSGTITPSDGTVTNAKIVDSTIELAKLSATGTKDATTFLRGDNTFAEAGGGIEMADQWRITANKTISSGTSDVTANWEQVDTDGGGFIGSALTESSGIFSFPSTGIYLIIAQTSMSSGASLAYGGLRIQTTTDNSTYDNAAEAYNLAPAAGQNLSANTSFIFDVTDITQDKFKLNVQANASCTFEGSTSLSRTGINVIRLGDT